MQIKHGRKYVLYIIIYSHLIKTRNVIENIVKYIVLFLFLLFNLTQYFYLTQTFNIII